MPPTISLHTCVKTNLMTHHGQYVQLSRDGHGLLAMDLQSGQVGGKVQFWKRNNDFALCYTHLQNQYLLTVKGDSLEVKETTNVEGDLQDENCWFKLDDVGRRPNGCCIRTSASPTKYLVINEDSSIGLSGEKVSDSLFRAEPCLCEEGCPGM